ncbi:MAG TPA: transporter substrate-binding domain-containing protein, partial [Telmatospirillum sp.]|nr:transporter substrate-binding domain-containing protein [Telmatospirillum sp.]
MALLFIVPFTTTAFVGCTLAADGPAKTRLPLLVGESNAPKMFLKDGKPTGYILEIAVEAMHRAGYEPDVQSMPWARALKNAQAGAGIVPSLSFSEERAKTLLFSGPMCTESVVLVTRADHDFPFNSVKDLSAHVLGNSIGSHYGPEYDAALPSFKINE